MAQVSEEQESTRQPGQSMQRQNKILAAWMCITSHTKNAPSALVFTMNHNVLLSAPWIVVSTTPITVNLKTNFWRRRPSCTFEDLLRRFLLLAMAAACAPLIAFGQSRPPVEQIAQHIENMRASKADVQRLAAHEALKTTWRQWLEEVSPEEALNFDSGELGHLLGVVDGGEKAEKIKVVSWNVELIDRTHRYGGFIMTIEGWTELSQDERLDLGDALDAQRRYKPEDWPGAIYYDVVVKNDNRKPVYLLLGWQGGNGTTTRKVVETLDVNRGRVRFGTPHLEVQGRLVKRHHLVFSDAVSVALRHEPEANRIVMDHLSPPSPELQGMHAYYGPDFTYDALVWHKGKWHLEEGVDVADPNLTQPWNDPNPRKRRRSSSNGSSGQR